MSQDYDKKRFNLFLDKQVKYLQKRILDLTEVAVTPGTFKALRSKVLGFTNDFRRDLEKEMEANYKLTHTPRTTYEDVIEIKPRVGKSNE